MVKVIINRAECVSCGTCVDTCPAFFELGKEDTLSQVVDAYRKEGKPEEGEAPLTSKAVSPRQQISARYR